MVPVINSQYIRQQIIFLKKKSIRGTKLNQVETMCTAQLKINCTTDYMCELGHSKKKIQYQYYYQCIKLLDYHYSCMSVNLHY